MRRLRQFLGSICLISLVMCLEGKETPSVLVKTSDGTLRGFSTADGVRVFLGVPYASAPVGTLRWKDPQPVKRWRGVRDATRFGPRPMQASPWSDMLFRSSGSSEDCLYLNIWSPAVAGPLAPVLVYIHGGGFIAGDGSELRYDGARLARRGIVVVTLNYRLGVFGFMAHPELSRERRSGGSGNYGLLDQRAALQWIQRNIAKFGGDPARVTIGGQSAGAGSVCAHLASELSRGLFIGAIGQSGSMLGSRSPIPLADAEAKGLAFQAAAGARSLRDLRGLAALRLLEVCAERGFDRFSPTLDGYFFREAPLQTYEHGRQADVPLLAGWTAQEVGAKNLLDEQPETLDGFHATVRQLYGAHAEEVLKLYAVSTDADVPRIATELASDRFVGANAWKWIDVHSKSNGKPVYHYLFTHGLPGTGANPAETPGRLATHSSDLPYWFGSLELLPGYLWDDKDRSASEVMQRVMVNFVTKQDPNGPGVPEWPWIRTSIPKIMVLSPAPQVVTEPNARRYELLNRIH